MSLSTPSSKSVQTATKDDDCDNQCADIDNDNNDNYLDNIRNADNDERRRVSV